MTYNQGCDSTAQPMRAGGSDISQRAGSQGSWTTGLLHINSMGSNQASNPHPRVWPLSRIAPGRSYWADAGTVSSGSPLPAKCCWSQQPRPGSGVRGGREAVRVREDHRRPEPGLVREPVVLPGQVQLLRERLGMRRGPPRGVRAVRGGSAMTVGPPAVPAEPVGLPPRAFPATCSPPSGGAPPHRAGSAT